MPSSGVALAWIIISPLAFITNFLSVLIILHYKPLYHSCDVAFISLLITMATNAFFLLPVPAVVKLGNFYWSKDLCTFYTWLSTTLRSAHLLVLLVINVYWMASLRVSRRQHMFMSARPIILSVCICWFVSIISGLIPAADTGDIFQFYDENTCKFLPMDVSRGFAVYFIIISLLSAIMGVISSLDTFLIFRSMKDVAKSKYSANRFHVPTISGNLQAGTLSHAKYNELNVSLELCRLVLLFSITSSVVNGIPLLASQFVQLILDYSRETMETTLLWLLLIESLTLPHLLWLLSRRYRHAAYYTWRVFVMMDKSIKEEDTAACTLQNFRLNVKDVTSRPHRNGMVSRQMNGRAHGPGIEDVSEEDENDISRSRHNGQVQGQNGSGRLNGLRDSNEVMTDIEDGLTVLTHLASSGAVALRDNPQERSLHPYNKTQCHIISIQETSLTSEREFAVEEYGFNIHGAENDINSRKTSTSSGTTSSGIMSQSLSMSSATVEDIKRSTSTSSRKEWKDRMQKKHLPTVLLSSSLEKDTGDRFLDRNKMQMASVISEMDTGSQFTHENGGTNQKYEALHHKPDRRTSTDSVYYMPSDYHFQYLNVALNRTHQQAKVKKEAHTNYSDADIGGVLDTSQTSEDIEHTQDAYQTEEDVELIKGTSLTKKDIRRSQENLRKKSNIEEVPINPPDNPKETVNDPDITRKCLPQSRSENGQNVKDSSVEQSEQFTKNSSLKTPISSLSSSRNQNQDNDSLGNSDYKYSDNYSRYSHRNEAFSDETSPEDPKSMVEHHQYINRASDSSSFESRTPGVSASFGYPTILRRNYRKFLPYTNLVISNVDDVDGGYGEDNKESDVHKLDNSTSKTQPRVKSSIVALNSELNSKAMSDITSLLEDKSEKSSRGARAERLEFVSDNQVQDYSQLETVSGSEMLRLKMKSLRSATAIYHSDDTTSDEGGLDNFGFDDISEDENNDNTPKNYSSNIVPNKNGPKLLDLKVRSLGSGRSSPSPSAVWHNSDDSPEASPSRDADGAESSAQSSPLSQIPPVNFKDHSIKPQSDIPEVSPTVKTRNAETISASNFNLVKSNQTDISNNPFKDGSLKLFPQGQEENDPIHSEQNRVSNFTTSLETTFMRQPDMPCSMHSDDSVSVDRTNRASEISPVKATKSTAPIVKPPRHRKQSDESLPGRLSSSHDYSEQNLLGANDYSEQKLTEAKEWKPPMNVNAGRSDSIDSENANDECASTDSPVGSDTESNVSDHSVTIEPYGQRIPLWMNDSLLSSEQKSAFHDHINLQPDPGAFSDDETSTDFISSTSGNSRSDSVEYKFELGKINSISQNDVKYQTTSAHRFQDPIIQYNFDDDTEEVFENSLVVDYADQYNYYRNRNLCFESIKEEPEDYQSDNTSIAEHSDGISPNVFKISTSKERYAGISPLQTDHSSAEGRRDHNSLQMPYFTSSSAGNVNENLPFPTFERTSADGSEEITQLQPGNGKSGLYAIDLPHHLTSTPNKNESKLNESTFLRSDNILKTSFPAAITSSVSPFISTLPPDHLQTHTRPISSEIRYKGINDVNLTNSGDRNTLSKNESINTSIQEVTSEIKLLQANDRTKTEAKTAYF